MHHKEDLIHAIEKEIELQQDYLEGEAVSTVYLGGGTPSLITAAETDRILKKLHTTFSIEPGAEITLEANPDDITVEKLNEWKASGINRLSIGVQSFFDEDLQWMNRAHNAKQALLHLQMAIGHFDNITIDLIYGTPQLTNEKWKHNVQTAISLGIPHLSCYALTVEPKTALFKMIAQRQAENVDPEKQSEQFMLLMQWAGEAGYEHYEISNFAMKDCRSRHNSSYWQGKKYIGLGPSAHSFNGNSRQWNIANNKMYIETIKNGSLPNEKELLTTTQQLNEYIMTALRTIEGVRYDKLETSFAVSRNVLLKKAEKFLQHNLLEKTMEALLLTREGKLLADGIAADLFF